MFKPKLALGFGFFAMFFATQSVPILAVPFYQMVLGVDPFLLGAALTIPIVISTMLSPWVGHLSDNFHSKYGRRRPFIFIATWFCCIAFGCLWMVSPEWSESEQLTYFVVWSIIYYVALIFMTVPLTCLSIEMSGDHHQRTEIMGFTNYFLKIGSILYQLLFPLSQVALFSSVFVGIKYVGWGVGFFVIGILGTIPSLFCTERTTEKVEITRNPKPTLSVWQNLQTLKHNTAFLILLTLTALQFCGGAFTANMDYYLIVYYQHSGDVETGSIWKGVLSTSYAIVGLLTIPLIKHASKTYGKKNALVGIY